MWFFAVAGETVWGATARVLTELLCLVLGVPAPASRIGRLSGPARLHDAGPAAPGVQAVSWEHDRSARCRIRRRSGGFDN